MNSGVSNVICKALIFLLIFLILPEKLFILKLHIFCPHPIKKLDLLMCSNQLLLCVFP